LRVVQRRGAFNLDFLAAMPASQAEQVLLTLDGVGRKTARCTLLFGFGLDVFPIDTHIERILKRLGCFPKGLTTTKLHEGIDQAIPRGIALSLHLNLITHGRRICHARRPGCPVCCLRRHCLHPDSPGAPFS